MGLLNEQKTEDNVMTSVFYVHNAQARDVGRYRLIP